MTHSEAGPADPRAALLAQVSSDRGPEIRDPATGEVIGRMAFGTPADVAVATAAAAAAQPGWAAAGDDARRAALLSAADAVEAHAEELAYVVTREQGKTMNGPGARREVAGCATWLRATAGTPLPAEVLVDEPGTHAELHYRPVGVIAAITPWNWPMLIACWQFAPALRMGNAVVHKPSEYTTLSGLALVSVLSPALPPGVLTTVTGAADVGDTLVRDPRVGKVLVTGSVETGRKVIAASAGNLSRLTLELGGNDAAIVLPGTDPGAIAEGLFWGAFVNSGQTCTALKRLYVPDTSYGPVVDALAAIAAKVPMGPGLDERNLLGPLQNQAQWNVVHRLVEDARARGARIVTGGDPEAGAPGYFYPATIIADIGHDAPLVRQEQFGPALPVVRYTDVDQAVEWANGADVGLGASVWSADRGQALAVAARLAAGTVWINSHGRTDPRMPFGGVKHSGYGLEFGVEGLKDVALPQLVNG